VPPVSPGYAADGRRSTDLTTPPSTRPRRVATRNQNLGPPPNASHPIGLGYHILSIPHNAKSHLRRGLSMQCRGDVAHIVRYR